VAFARICHGSMTKQMVRPKTMPRLKLRYFGSKQAVSASNYIRLAERFLTCSEKAIDIAKRKMRSERHRSSSERGSLGICPTSSSTSCHICRQWHLFRRFQSGRSPSSKRQWPIAEARSWRSAFWRIGACRDSRQSIRERNR
jgi:hypothetical protein